MIPVHCAHAKMVPTDSLKPHPRNVQLHPSEQVKLLANVIAKTGWRSPIVVSELSGYVIKGHGRLLAAKFLKLKDVPIDLQAYPDEAAELADLVADNRIGDLAEWDMPILKDILQDLDTGDFDLLRTGFDLPSIEAMMTAAPPELPPEPPDPPPSIAKKIIVVYDTDEERDAIVDLLGASEIKDLYFAKHLLGQAP